MTETKSTLQNELTMLNRTLQDALKAYHKETADIGFIEVLTLLLPYDWNKESVEKRGKPVVFVAQHAHRAVLDKAVAEKEAHRQVQCHRLEAIAIIIYDLKTKLDEAIGLVKKGVL
nr:MAG TPA: hypothetical protein [Caudoviricetes sp.]